MYVLYIHVTLRRYIFLFNNQPDACSILTLLGNGHQNPHETYQCRMYSRKLLMMGKEVARNV